MERRSSTNSDSSVEPMETSSSNKTGASDAYSSMVIKSNDSDNVDSDENEEQSRNVIRRKNVRQMMDEILKFLPGSNATNHSIRSTKITDSSPTLESTASQSLNVSGNNNTNSVNDNMKYVCPICDVISTTPHEFSVHIRGHNNDSSDDNQSYTCRICSKVLSSASSLDRHVLVHTGERPFKCKYCNLTFTTNGNMHRHIRTHKQHERENYESDGSSDSTNSFASIGSNNNNNNHYSKGESYGEKRKSTDEDLNSKRKLRTINNNNIINSKTQTFCCPVCVRNDFSSMLSLENHMDQEHPSIPAKCRHCEIVFKSHKALNAHRCGNVAKAPITQGFKDLTFVDFSSEKFPIIARSICERNVRAPSSGQKFECPSCSKAFPCASALQMHASECSESAAHNLSTKRVRRSSDTSDDDARRVDFFANLDLQNKSQAMSVSTSELLSTPSSTDKSFSSPFSLKDRFLSPYQHDTKDLADIQSIINNTSSSGGFWKQLDRSGTSEKDLDLKGGDEEEAQDAFTAEFRKMKLRGEFPCRLCSSVFPNLRALKGHNRIHLSAAGPGPYRCNMCPYMINDKAALIRHMRTHNGDRPYECSICNYAFTTKANCERHLRNRHGKNTRDEIKRSIIYHPSEDSSCDDPLKKMAMFSSPEGKREEQPPKASTPVSHLRSSLSFEPATPKIQVRSLDKLIDPQVQPLETKAVDLSSNDVLDLSKKTSSAPANEEEDEKGDLDFNLLEKNQQLLLLQQKFLSEALPKLNPAHYFQLLYRNFGFPPAFPLHPLFLQSSLMGQTPPSSEELKSFLPTPQMSGGSLLMNPFAPQPASEPKPETTKVPERPETPPMETPTAIQSATTTPIKPSASLSPGPVKMVIKNGVLMPKQKQRRYRTERPFSCEHCSARFTLRSNMERHIKQQHPQYWAQRQKGGHHLMRRSSNSLHPASMNPMIPQNMTTPNFSPNAFSGISDQVKYAILAQQLKQNRDAPGMILHSALSNGNGAPTGSGNANDDDEPKLVIDEEDSQEPTVKVKVPESADPNEIARKIAQDILEQAKKIKNTNSMIISSLQDTKEQETRAAVSVPKPQVKTETEPSHKEEDLASISKLVDNATMSFGSYFNRQSEQSAADQSDEEGLVASGSTSESNNSGTDDPNPTAQTDTKKKSAYSMAPNRVSCPYCQRMFPWSSSLRRHILTHTGQKPFKCSHCPLLFTTKSNCDRHLLRKHGDVESAMSVPVPIEEMPEPKKERVAPPLPPAQATDPKSPFSIPQILQASTPPVTPSPASVAAQNALSNSDLPFKCHLCDSSFSDRTACLDHMKAQHLQEFSLIMGKVNLESESDVHTASPDDDDIGDTKGGKYPDYTNRKVICAFCMRRFWSTEDLRRHVRTHSGERPFQCNVCLRRFTLKHSMLRHRKKHANHKQMSNNNSTANSASDMSDEEPSGPPASQPKIPNLISKDLIWKLAMAQREQRDERSDAKPGGEREGEEGSDLIGNLLGISDRGILNKLLSSADEAAKLLGVQNNE